MNSLREPDAGNPHVRFDEGETPNGHWPWASHSVRVSLLYMTSLAWNLKAWFGLILPNARRGAELIKMEFRRFLHAIPITATIGLLGRSRRPKVEFAPSLGTPVLRLCAIRSQNSAAKISKCDSGAAGALRVGFFAYFGTRRPLQTRLPRQRHRKCSPKNIGFIFVMADRRAAGVR